MTGESLSFGGVADRYERARPGYPVEAVRWLTGEQPLRVLELGAGTGKLTGTLLELGHNVMASDPDERMLAVLATHASGAHVRTHGAEEIPLPDGIADVVIAAQAWHWFDHERAIPEIARVLKPGGTLALVWNTRDETVPWVARLGRLMGSNDNHRYVAEALHDRLEFPEVEEATFRHWQHLDRDGLLDLAASRSYVATMSEEPREETLSRVSDLYDDYGRGPDGMKLPYVTRCYRATVHHQELPVSAEATASADTSQPVDEPTDPAFSPAPVVTGRPETPGSPTTGPVAPAPVPRSAEPPHGPDPGSPGQPADPGQRRTDPPTDGPAGRGGPSGLSGLTGPTWRSGSLADEATLLIDFR